MKGEKRKKAFLASHFALNREGPCLLREEDSEPRRKHQCFSLQFFFLAIFNDLTASITDIGTLYEYSFVE